MSLRKEFVELAMAEGQSIRELCRRFGISPPTAYEWLSRYQQEGERGLEDRSRRPRRSPSRTVPVIEEKVLEQRRANSDWGGRKISTVLRNEGCEEVPAPSTITGILRRNG